MRGDAETDAGKASAIAVAAPAAGGVARAAFWRGVPAMELQILLAIVALAVIFSWTFPDSFATSGTLLNMARVAGIMLVVSIGQSFALIVGGFDISVGATMGLVSVTCALLMKGGMESARRSRSACCRAPASASSTASASRPCGSRPS